MNRITACGAVAVALLVMSGCSATDADAPEEVAAPATVGQFASVVARHDSQIRDSADKSGRCFLDMMMGDSEALTQGCVDSAEKGRRSVIEIKDRFEGLGDAPEEIDDLAQRMIRGGEHMDTTVELDIMANCDDVQSDECSTAVDSVTRSLEEVIVPELDAWSPYL